MKTYLLLCGLLMQPMIAEQYIAEREYSIIIDEELKQPFLFYFNQECNNTLQAQYSNGADIPPHQTSNIRQWFSWHYWSMIGKIGIIGGIALAAYALKTKLNLYNLSKACFQAALWSLWQTKSNGPHIHETDPDTDLLHAILKTYHTEKYAVAISGFLHDVDKEMEHLETYLTEARSAQAHVVSLLLPDMSQEITEAETRLRKLALLKQRVLTWLNNHNTAPALQELAW